MDTKKPGTNIAMFCIGALSALGYGYILNRVYFDGEKNGVDRLHNLNMNYLTGYKNAMNDFMERYKKENEEENEEESK